MLSGVRVVEVADELGEYCGLLLAGLGADVIKIEPPSGSSTRHIGPFHGDAPDPERSLFFWSYNRGKRSVALDLANGEERDRLLTLLSDADVLLDSSCGKLSAELGLNREELAQSFPSLVHARMTPFGDVGPWWDFKGSDLVHLALGGVMMNCGYDPRPDGSYDLPPIAPQMWHAYHIAGEQLAMGIVAALLHKRRTGEGQDVACAVHEAVSKATETDVMNWVMRRAPVYRQTCRHALETLNRVPNISHTKDGRWYTALSISARDKEALVPFLDRYGMAADLRPEEGGREVGGRTIPGMASSTDADHVQEVIQRFVRAYRYEEMPWREAQNAGLLWAPLRKPHENVADEHWQMRGTFAQIEHPELGINLPYPVSKWMSDNTAWQARTRAPLLGEHNGATWRAREEDAGPVRSPATARAPLRSALGKPFPLQGIRIFDFSWFLATAGGTRFLAALGADVIKVEWKGNPDTRFGAMAPVGGRAAREAATTPLEGVRDGDMGGQFNNKNPGKRGLSLNLRHPDGLKIAKQLVALSDVVAEGFSPGVLDRLGFGYDVMKAIRPDIIYAKQSGMGGSGMYGAFRTVGPVAAAFGGQSEMSGLPEPAMPAGWGYSFLDWLGAYGFGLAILGALHHRDRTGQGQWIDSSQCESGIFTTAPAILDHSANGHSWHRYGNRSPWKPAAPHGAYRCLGEDRWIAIACFDDLQWKALACTAGHPEWLAEPAFATLDGRLANQAALDALVEGWTATQDAHACMLRLQAAGVPAGVCQSAQDRCDHDPQLAALEWMTELKGTKIGQWPVTSMPVKLSATPAYIGGPIDRAAPCYGEDNETILGELLGYSTSAIADLRAREVI
jgi:crotonobetainyl-CoA:carnitine CoA-transferase CaiB-like acyl-CoA transferase